MIKTASVVAFVSFFASAIGATAATITFDAVSLIGVASYVDSGVTFTAVGGGGLLESALSPNGTTGLLDSNAVRKELRADIAGGATSVSVDLG
jgi:hypothetical protein